MTLQEQIIAQRKAQGLMLVIQAPDGHRCTLYPKDHATLQRWKAGYEHKGYRLVPVRHSTDQ